MRWAGMDLFMTKKNQTVKSRPFKSKFYGECAICNEAYAPGALIVRLLTGYYRLEGAGINSRHVRIKKFTLYYAHARCGVQPPTKPVYLPDHYRWCTVCDDWWDMPQFGPCPHTKPWHEEADRQRWKERYDNRTQE